MRVDAGSRNRPAEQVWPKVFTIEAGDPLYFYKPLGGDLVPLHHGSSRKAEFSGNFRQHPAVRSDEGHTLHGQCLPPGSARLQAICLPTGCTLPGMIFRMDIGDRIKAARMDAGVSQRKLAKAIGVTHGLVGQWESHVKKPGRDMLQKVAKELGRSSSYLIGEQAEDEEILSLTAKDEIELILLYRRLSKGQKASHLALFRTSVDIRREIEKERGPAKGKRVDA